MQRTATFPSTNKLSTITIFSTGAVAAILGSVGRAGKSISVAAFVEELGWEETSSFESWVDTARLFHGSEVWREALLLYGGGY